MVKKFDMFPYLMLLPAAALLAGICFYPIFSGVFMSFTNISLMNPKAWKFIGIENFLETIKDFEFTSAFGFTWIYTVSCVLCSYIIGLICALFMNRAMRLRGLVRSLLLMPWVIPVVVCTISWIWLLNDQNGFVNTMLKQMGLIKESILFLGQIDSAKVTVIMFDSWRRFPFMALVLLSSMQTIPPELYEASYIDGANGWKSFWMITMPLIRRQSLLIILLQAIWAFNTFDNIYLLTKGGPALATQVISIYAYNTAFYRSSLGYASALSVTMMFFMILLAMVYFRLNRNSEE